MRVAIKARRVFRCQCRGGFIFREYRLFCRHAEGRRFGNRYDDVDSVMAPDIRHDMILTIPAAPRHAACSANARRPSQHFNTSFPDSENLLYDDSFHYLFADMAEAPWLYLLRPKWGLWQAA